MKDNRAIIILDDSPGRARETRPRRIAVQFELDTIGQFTISFVKGPAKLSDLVPMAHSLCEKLTKAAVEDLHGRGDKIACRKGCTHCCRYLAPVSAAEAFYITDRICAMPAQRRRTILRSSLLSAGYIMDNKENLTVGESTKGESGHSRLENISNWYSELNLSCPFLVNKVCTIYKHRPLVCREHMVTGAASACEAGSPDEPQKVVLPVSVAEALAKVCSTLSGKISEAIILPLMSAWCDSNRGLAEQTRPAELLVEHFIKALKANAGQKTLAANFAD